MPLLPSLAGAQVPEPVPVVVEAVLGERPLGRRPEPQVVIDALRHGAPASRGRCSAGCRRSRPGRTPTLPSLPAWTYSRAAITCGVLRRCVPDLHHHLVLRGPPRPSAGLRSGCARPASRQYTCLPRLAGPDGRERVPVVGRGDDDRRRSILSSSTLRMSVAVGVSAEVLAASRAPG